MNARFAAKWKLVQLLYQRVGDKQQVIDLFSVLDWMMRLPEQLKRSLWHNIEVLEEQEKMRYVTSVEQIGIERACCWAVLKASKAGIAKRGEAYALRRLLQKRFGPLSDDVLAACKPPASTSWSCGWIAPWMLTAWPGCLLSKRRTLSLVCNTNVLKQVCFALACLWLGAGQSLAHFLLPVRRAAGIMGGLLPAGSQRPPSSHRQKDPYESIASHPSVRPAHLAGQPVPRPLAQR